MVTDLNGNKRKKHSLASSFKFGFQGIAAALNERNVQIHSVISIAVIFFGFVFSISKFEWFAVLLAIGGMVALEMLNTAIERTVDMYTVDFHPLAKQAKDIAAGAVLIFAIISVIIGMMVFIPKIIAVLG
ncbi:MAG TPA: diacylglycerol kinase [Bacillus bacterium]|nr:diacylglycerol kinase [Bacillus sp. (in: firmicutes)]